ncbi:hypothetical protein QN277_025454 [Acacia crassicarpa]|uniref:Uncharacterized protein n=1 Tax=Acacia crassicarpa TaxID=499986 RepID=A0AAE1MEB6_9FABA|nr:hypothetical protein QN277_025454 [Acacia crassicarpa]
MNILKFQEYPTKNIEELLRLFFSADLSLVALCVASIALLCSRRFWVGNSGPFPATVCSSSWVGICGPYTIFLQFLARRGRHFLSLRGIDFVQFPARRFWSLVGILGRYASSVCCLSGLCILSPSNLPSRRPSIVHGIDMMRGRGGMMAR